MNLRAARILLVALLALETALLVFGPKSADHLPGIATAEAAGERPNWWDDAAMGVRHAAWINVALLALLLASAGGWTRPLPISHLPSPISHLPSPISHLPSPKWFAPLVIAAAVLCLGLRLPLASKSLWWDEAWVIKEASHGKWLPDKKHAGRLRFLAHDWRRCAWYYQKPTNHAPMSLLQKTCIAAWQKVTGSPRSAFHDLAARVPALIASVAAVILLAGLLRAWGKAGAGVVAAFVLAIHPWHIRYGVDARAYALVVPLCAGGMLAVTRMAQSGGRALGPWISWGVIQFLWLWSFPNGILDVAALNLAAAVLLWKSHAAGRDRWTALLRLLVTNVFAAMLFIQMFLPNLMQARRWAGQESDKHILDLALAASTASQLLSGRNIDAARLQLPVLLGSAALVTVISAMIFARRKQLDSGVVLLPTLLAAAVLFAGATRTFESYYYSRFAIALLPVLIAAFCIALVNRSVALTGILCAVAFIASSGASIASLIKLPIAPLHDVADFVRSASPSTGAAPLVACYGLAREVMPVYEPRCIPLEKRADVAAAMARARAERRGLFVIYGYSSFNRTVLPDGFPLLDDRSLFEEVKALPGLEPDFLFRVLQLK